MSDWNDWKPQIHATLMFIVRGGEVLLIEKKRGHGAGKINAPGGKIDPGETPEQAAIRETQEELHVTPLAPRKIGELWFEMSDYPSLQCHVFRADDFSGTPTETDEAVPLWSKHEDVPYDRMWEDDLHWLPLLLENQTFHGRFRFEKEAMLEMELDLEIDWERRSPVRR